MSDLWKRIAVYSTLAAAICLVAWFQLRLPWPGQDAAMRPVPAAAKAVADPDADPYRLQPDVRVLQAAGDLHHLITGAPLEDARAVFDRGEWRVVHRGVEVGRLPRFPEYRDLERLLSGWAIDLGLRDSLEGPWRRGSAASRAKRRAAIADRLERLEATAAADLADRAWSARVRDLGLLRLAAHSLALLGVQTVDEVGGADRVAARGLALVSACAALDPAAVAADAALVADGMGYAAAAWERTESLPADDAVRRFVRQEDEELEKQAGHKTASREERFLALKRLARRHELEPWRRWLERHFADDAALALTCTSLEIGRFETHVPAAMQVLAGVVRDLEMIGEVEEGEGLPAGPGSLDALVREFERLMGGMRPKADGVFLDAGVLRAYYRTCFYSALAVLGEHVRESLSSSPDTRAFASDLGEGDEGVAGEFQRWYTNLANAKLGRPGIPALRKDLQTMPHFGAPLLLRTFLAIEEHSSYGDVGLRAAARRIAKRLDTRPRHLTAFADIVRRHVLDQERAEDLLERGIAALGPRELRLMAWWAGYRQDRDSLESLLHEPDLDPREQAGILDELAAIPGADSNAVEAGFRRSIASNRDSWELVDAYTRLLRARGRWELARGALERWLDRDVADTGPFEEIFARTRLAQTYADQGRYERAIEAIEPVVESQQFGAMDCMVDLLEKTGRLARAETLAVFAWGRYPDSPGAQARVIGLCWRQRKYELAARMLAQAPVPLRAHDVRTELAPYFVQCFRESPAEGIRAIEAILASGYGPGDHLAQLAAALDQAGAPRMAFEVQSRMPAEGQMAIGKVDLCYRYRKHWKGEEAALEWVRPHLREMAPGDRALLGCIAYDSGDYELLWEIEDVGPGQSGIEFHWLLRAAASARMGAARDPRRAELERHYARGGGEYYATLGRFLLGREDERAALATATDPRSTCEALYYLGLKAQCEGRIRQASRWYLRCVETGQFHNGEYRWAYDQLHRWAARGVSLARLEAEARGRPRHLAGAAH